MVESITQQRLAEYRDRELRLIEQVAEYQDKNRQLENKNKKLSIKLAQISNLARG